MAQFSGVGSVSHFVQEFCSPDEQDCLCDLTRNSGSINSLSIAREHSRVTECDRTFCCGIPKGQFLRKEMLLSRTATPSQLFTSVLSKISDRRSKDHRFCAGGSGRPSVWTVGCGSPVGDSAVHASAGPATKARNSLPSLCLRVTKLPISTEELLSSPIARDAKVNNNSNAVSHTQSEKKGAYWEMLGFQPGVAKYRAIVISETNLDLPRPDKPSEPASASFL